MKYLVYILLLSFLIPHNILAQTWSWNASKGQKEENAHHIDYDNAGNVYTYHTDLILRKFNSSGTQLWTYTYPITGSFPYSDFAVEKSTGNIFLFDGTGTRMMKVSTVDGTPITTLAYDFHTVEIWQANFNCNEVLVASGGGYKGYSYQYMVIANDLSSYTGYYYSSFPDHDIVMSTPDNGYIYLVHAETDPLFGEPQLANAMYKSPLSPVGLPVWSVQTDFSFYEGNIYQYRGYTTQTEKFAGTVNYNGMAQTANYLYLYDGITLEKYDKSGNYLASVIVGDSRYGYAGLDVDCKCTTTDGKIYVGVNNEVKVYNNDLSLYTTYTYPDSVYDIAVENERIDVTGNHFIQIRPISQPACSTGTLPIQLVTLYAKNGIMYWITASETNNDHFTIYKSGIDVSFTKEGIVKGAGNTSIQSRYSYIIKDGRYYALTQTDYDGKEKLLGIIRIVDSNSEPIVTHAYNFLGQQLN